MKNAVGRGNGKGRHTWVVSVRNNIPGKILLVVHKFLPRDLGGVEIYTFHLAKALAAAGHDMSVLYPEEAASGQGESIEEDWYNGIRIHRMPVRRVSPVRIRKRHLLRSSKFFLETRNPPTERLFRELLDREPFDLVHFHNLHIDLPFTLLEIAGASGRPVCLTLHDAWLICPRTHLFIAERNEVCDGPSSVRKCVDCLYTGAWPVGKKDVTQRIASRQEHARRVLQSIDLVASPSSYLATRFTEHGFARDRILVSPLGVRRKNTPRHRERSGGVVFGCFGAIHGVKNTLHLVESFRSVSGNARLILWGNGMRRYIGKVVASARRDSRIEYRGPYEPDQLPDILGQMDIAVVPSLIESYSLVVREALAGRVPVLASNVGGIPEIIRDGQNGILFDPREERDLTRRLQEIVEDPSVIDRLRDRIEPPRSIAEDAAEWGERYERLAGKKGG